MLYSLRLQLLLYLLHRKLQIGKNSGSIITSLWIWINKNTIKNTIKNTSITSSLRIVWGTAKGFNLTPNLQHLFMPHSILRLFPFDIPRASINDFFCNDFLSTLHRFILSAIVFHLFQELSSYCYHFHIDLSSE